MPWLNPITIRIAAVAAALLAIFAVLYVVERRAAERALQKVERANADAARRADDGERDVLTCPPELWSREMRRCATKLH